MRAPTAQRLINLSDNFAVFSEAEPYAPKTKHSSEIWKISMKFDLTFFILKTKKDRA